MRSMAGMTSTCLLPSGSLDTLVAPASPNSRPSLVSAVVATAFPPVGSGFFIPR